MLSTALMVCNRKIDLKIKMFSVYRTCTIKGYKVCPFVNYIVNQIVIPIESDKTEIHKINFSPDYERSARVYIMIGLIEST